MRLLKAAAIFGTWLIALPSLAQTRGQIPEMHVYDASIEDVVLWFEMATGLEVRTQEPLYGRVRNERVYGELEHFCRWLKTKHGLDYFRNGETVFLFPLDQSVKRMIVLRNIKAREVSDLLVMADLSTEAMQNQASDSGIVTLKGPREYVSLVEALIADQEANRRVKVRRAGILQQDEF